MCNPFQNCVYYTPRHMQIIMHHTLDTMIDACFQLIFHYKKSVLFGK